MNTITLVINDDEMSSLYHIIKRARKYQSGRIDSKSAEWMSKLSEAYRSMKKYNLVFRGQDAVVLLSLCDNYREHYSKDDEYGVLAQQIIEIAGFHMSGVKDVEAARRHENEALVAHRRENEERENEERENEERENERQEQMQRERLELQRRASAGDAWDTGDTGVNNGVWDAGDEADSWDTDNDVPY